MLSIHVIGLHPDVVTFWGYSLAVTCKWYDVDQDCLTQWVQLFHLFCDCLFVISLTYRLAWLKLQKTNFKRQKCSLTMGVLSVIKDTSNFCYVWEVLTIRWILGPLTPVKRAIVLSLMPLSMKTSIPNGGMAYLRRLFCKW